MIRLKDSRIRALALDTRPRRAPYVGIPILMGAQRFCAVVSRHILTAAMECPKIARAEYNLETKQLILSGVGVRYALVASQSPVTVCETLTRWAEVQRRQAARPKLNKTNRKLIALDREIAKLEKQMSRRCWSKDEPPKNPLLKARLETYDWFREHELVGWHEERVNKPLRSKLVPLGAKTWKHWTDLRAACAKVGATLPAKIYKNRLTEKPYRLVEINRSVLIHLCGVGAYGRDRPAWHEENHEDYLRDRAAWLKRKRERKALESRIADLKEIRSMPERLAAMDIGLPEGVEVLEDVDE